MSGSVEITKIFSDADLLGLIVGWPTNNNVGHFMPRHAGLRRTRDLFYNCFKKFIDDSKHFAFSIFET